MSSKFEYYDAGDDAGLSIHDDDWRAQTFTPASWHNITSVKLLLGRSNSPGTVTVSIKATDGSGHPTGGDLCSGTTDGDTLTTDSAGEWREITLGAGCNLTASTKYAIVVRALDGDGSNYIVWRADTTSPTYAGGNCESSGNGGVDWSADAYDNMFEDWGEMAKSLSGALTGSGAVGRKIKITLESNL